LYTPREIIDLVRVVMGEIDLDPASDDIAQQWVQARNYYTPTLDGLSHPGLVEFGCTHPLMVRLRSGQTSYLLNMNQGG
jgi:hypothetical protein